jgi:hypothetical protein
VSPNPARGALRLDYGLMGTSPATLEMLDVAGRRILSKPVGAMGRGRHQLVVQDPLPVGVYLLRLVEGRRVRTAKVAIIR